MKVVNVYKELFKNILKSKPQWEHKSDLLFSDVVEWLQSLNGKESIDLFFEKEGFVIIKVDDVGEAEWVLEESVLKNQNKKLLNLLYTVSVT